MSVVSLRDEITKTMETGCAGIVSELNNTPITPLTVETMQAFADNMQISKCNDLTSLISKGETVSKHIESAAEQWQTSAADLAPSYLELKKLMTTTFKLVVSAFAVKCIVSKSAQKRLPSAKVQAERAIDFASKNEVVLDDFVLDKLNVIKNLKGIPGEGPEE